MTPAAAAAGAPRIAVTGLGLVTPIGSGREQVWRGLLAGRSGVGPVGSFDTSAFSVHLGAEVRGFDPEPYLRRLPREAVGRAGQLAVAAARLALDDAGLDPERLDRRRTGVVMGTTSGEPREVERLDDAVLDRALDRVGAEFIRRYPCHTIAAAIGRELDLAGVNAMIPTACAAGSYAIAHAADLLTAGRAELMLAGGADAFSRITYTGFARLGAIAPERCQPFDRRRRGMIPGEGAAVLVLELLDRARARGARVYAEIAGYGLSCDAHHMTAAHPEGEGAVRAMRAALAASGASAAEVSYVSAHGTGTPTNDRLEVIAFRRVFGDRAPATPISSVKSMLGHTMGAASAIETAVCALAAWSDRIPPTVNLDEPEEDDLDFVANAGRDHPVAVAMNNAYAFGGSNASLVLRKCEA
jgi:3-oxoacyl-[acyl-carrier-protein] synthase II